MEGVFQDARYACRSLRRAPGFAALVIATLAIGIGANLTMFSLMRAVLWRPLPYPEPDRVVMIRVDARKVPNTGATRSEVLGFRERSHTLQQVSTIDAVDANLEYAGEMEHVPAAQVTDEFLPLLGVRPALGRLLDSRVDVASAVLISDELWRRRFSADPRVVGRAVRLNGIDVQIAGVLPAGFRLFLPPDVNAAEEVDVWLPERIDGSVPYRGVTVAARLRPEVTLDQANAELATLAAQFVRERPEFYSGVKGWQASPFDRGAGATVHFTARPLHEDTTRNARPTLFLLSGAVGFVLLIACVNSANLLLTRGTARERELEIRRASGAGTTRIVRQLLTESVVLATAAGAVGLACAGVVLKLFVAQSGSHLPMQSRIAIDGWIAVIAVAMPVITSLLFGLLPAWRLAAGTGALRAGRGGTAASRARRLQRTLVVAEVALSIVPLVCGGLMLRSFVNLIRSPLGFDPADVVTAKVPMNLARYPQSEQQWGWLSDLMERVRGIAGVEAVSAASPLPLAPSQEGRRVGRVDQPDAPPIRATQHGAMPGYLQVMKTPLLEGRDFTEGDVVRSRNVTIIDERLARRLWPEGAIGKRLAVYRTGWRHDLEVVGVSAAVRTKRVRDGDVPYYMMPSIATWLVIRTHQSAEKMAPLIQAAVSAAHSGRAAYDVRPMSAYVADSIGDTRFVLTVLAAFAAAAVLLAASGLYATMSYLTAQRTREFGIRLALGSTVNGVVGIVIRESALLAAAGIGAGLLGAAAVTAAIREMLYDVRPLDPATMAGVVVLVTVVALGAASVPAWRVRRIDPQVLLRSE